MYMNDTYANEEFSNKKNTEIFVSEKVGGSPTCESVTQKEKKKKKINGTYAWTHIIKKKNYKNKKARQKAKQKKKIK